MRDDDYQFKLGDLTEIEERYIEQGYPSVYNVGGTIPDPEFVIFIAEHPEFRLGTYDLRDYTTNQLIELLANRAGLCAKSEAREFCEEKGFTLIVEDQKYPGTTKFKYTLLN